jgi:hypothetical protein
MPAAGALRGRRLVMPTYHFERESRTTQSESLIVTNEGREIGRVDLHFGRDVVQGTLCVPEDFSEDDIQDLIAEVDERLVLPVEPFRDDFIVTVWIGRQAGVYSEDMEEELLEDELNGDGHREA